MIPRHRPPFGLGELFRMMFFPSRDCSVEQVEDECAVACGIPYAVLLPSARAGICWGLRATVSDGTPVLVPAYTCRAVHEAVARSGGRPCFVDTEPATFLMDPTAVAARGAERCAIVQSEIYGHSYAPDTSGTSYAAPQLRIVDAAMTVPVPAVFARLRWNDLAVVSFGIGKCVYAGWGGVGLTRDPLLAAEIRDQRNAHLGEEHLSLALGRAIRTVLRTLAHARVFYGALYRFRTPPDLFPAMPETWNSDIELSNEWSAPSTHLDRRLVCRNLKHTVGFSERRQALAALYRRNLCGIRHMGVPPVSSFAMSHYTIRVPSVHRDAIRASLLRLGIDTGRLFRFPGYLSETTFPNAARAASEVINLPLDDCLTSEDVAFICEGVRGSISRIWSGRSDCEDTPGLADLERAGP
jgi:dTDP-4-amino-4,6-dideoxygalactose transaminase